MKVIVVHKTSRIDFFHSNELKTLKHSNMNSYCKLVEAAENNKKSIETTIKALDTVGINYTVIEREQLTRFDKDVDLVLAVGGDGTVLEVSHYAIDVPLAGINSDPIRSVGYFCASSADNFEQFLRDWLNKKVEQFTLQRLSLEIDGVPSPIPCMNDLLISQQNPAMMTRYILYAGERVEEQMSSGIWISTPAGSTGGIRSAGGTVMPLEGKLLQYLVREPFQYRSLNYDLLRGVRDLKEKLSIQSLMDKGRIYIDGPYLSYPFSLGTLLTISAGPPLQLLGLDRSLRQR